MKSLMVIGGTDSSGGAGMTRDTATAQSFDCIVKPIVTSVTAQTNSALVHRMDLPPETVGFQLETALSDTPPDAIKIGMLGSAEIIEIVLRILGSNNIPIVFDPVLKTSSGGILTDVNDVTQLFPKITLLTPNLVESAILTNRPVANNNTEIKRQATILQDMGAKSVLIKGGHGAGDTCDDHLFHDLQHKIISRPRLAESKRGTGCTLSSAIACQLANGVSISGACQNANDFVWQWLTHI